MLMISSLGGLFAFAGYLLVSLVMLAVFTRVYTAATPYDEAAEIRAGHMAPAIALSGAMLGYTMPLLVASYAQAGFVEFLAWGVIAGLVQLGVFWLLHRLLPTMIETNNAAGALCIATASVCAGLINAASFLP
jgi:putative membrane protein